MPGIKRNKVSRRAAIHANHAEAQLNWATGGTGKRDRNHKKRSTTNKISITISFAYPDGAK
jgi:hypothetical protein